MVGWGHQGTTGDCHGLGSGSEEKGKGSQLGTSMKSTATPAATYVDGEYIYQTPDSYSSHSNSPSTRLTSSSSTFAASQTSHHQNQNHSPTSPTAVSFTSTPPLPPARFSPLTKPNTNSSHQSTLPTSTLRRSLSTSNRNSFLSALNAPVPSPPHPSVGGSQDWPLEFRLMAITTGAADGSAAAATARW